MPKAMPKTLPTSARVCDKRGLSSREAAELESSLLEDFGVVTAESEDAVIDKAKVDRERRKLRRSLRTENATVTRSPLRAVYFDGHKDVTLAVQKRPDGVSHRIQTKEKHVAIVVEPVSVYISNITVTSGSAAVIAETLCAELRDTGYDLASMLALGCDGTVVNTGHIGGVIRLIELKLSRHLLITNEASKVPYLVDTGSDLCCFPRAQLHDRRPATSHTLSAANNRSIKTYGFLTVHLRFADLRRTFPALRRRRRRDADHRC